MCIPKVIKNSPSSQTPESLLFFAKYFVKYSSTHIYGYIKEHRFLTVSACHLIKTLENRSPYFLVYPLIDADIIKFLNNYSSGPQIFGFSLFF